jgi:hypothetical protein
MSDEAVLFPPYGLEALRAILRPRLARAFRADALSDDVRAYGVRVAAKRWGDARKALTLFRQAGETATERGLSEVTRACLDANIESAETDQLRETLLDLPPQHFLVLYASTLIVRRRSDAIVQPVTTSQTRDAYESILEPSLRIGERAMRETITDLETMGLLETWLDSRGNEGRVKLLQTTFDPEVVHELAATYRETKAAESDGEGNDGGDSEPDSGNASEPDARTEASSETTDVDADAEDPTAGDDPARQPDLSEDLIDDLTYDELPDEVPPEADWPWVDADGALPPGAFDDDADLEAVLKDLYGTDEAGAIDPPDLETLLEELHGEEGDDSD